MKTWLVLTTNSAEGETHILILDMNNFMYGKQVWKNGNPLTVLEPKEHGHRSLWVNESVKDIHDQMMRSESHIEIRSPEPPAPARRRKKNS